MFKDLTGKKFGKLTAIKVVGKNKKNENIWLCDCECGNQTKVIGSRLRSGHTTSCGCYKKVCCIKHGMLHSRPYSIWQGMLNRCRNKKAGKYPNYGGRGISVCDEWKKDFNNFYFWAIDNGYDDSLTIERKDVNGNYEPNNCCWISLADQARNKTTSVFITYNGETHTLSEWARLLGIKQQTLSKRYRDFNGNVDKIFYKGDLRYGRKRNNC